MRPIQFDHIAIAVPRLTAAQAVLVGELGGEPTFGAQTGAFRFWHWRYEGGGRLEILEPAGPNGFLHRFLAERGPGIHHPPRPANPPPPVTMLGLRLRAHSRERAQTLWAQIIRGEHDATPDGTLVYRWPGSFMRIAVEIDPGREEGPICIEYASRRPVALPEGPHPILGAVFRKRPTS